MQENEIRRHVLTIPKLMETYGRRVMEEVKNTIPVPVLSKVEHIILTGCGYSYAAGINGAYIFEEIAGVSTENLFSVDASRHKNPDVLPKDKRTMVIGISNSGIVARIEEGLRRFGALGACTVAFTQDKFTRCGKAAEYVLSTAVPQLESSLPLRSYVVTLLNCYGLAYGIAKAKGKAMDHDIQLFYRNLSDFAAGLELQMDQIIKEVRSYAERTKAMMAYEFVGSGMGYGSAWLGKQLMAGQTGRLGIDCCLEDWLHSDFFLSQPQRIATILYLPSNSPAQSRLMEVKGYMQYLKRPLGVITDRNLEEETDLSVIHVPYSRCEYLNPLADVIPTALFAGDICELIGEQYSRGFRDRWDFSKGGKATEFSKIEIIK